MNKTKKAIFQSAIEIFSKAGYNGATMDDIAVNAGVAKGTLYYHFKSKEEIFNYIITNGLEMMRVAVEDAVKAEENILLKIRTMCKFQLELIYENKDFFKVIMSQVWGQELRQVELRKCIEEYLKTIEKFLQEGMDNGVLKNSDSNFMAYTFFGTLFSAAIYELINAENTDIDMVIDNLMNFIFKGIEV